MRKTFCLLLTLLVAFGCVTGKDDADDTQSPVVVDDPDGTVVVSLTEGFSTSFAPFVGRNAVLLDTSLVMSGAGYLFTDLLEHEGLGAVEKIPVVNTSWFEQMKVAAGHAYVAASVNENSVRFARLFFGQEKNGKLTAKYQSPFYGDATRFYLTIHKLDLSREAGDTVVVFSKSTNYRIRCADTTWMRVVPAVNRFMVVYDANDDYYHRENTIYLEDSLFTTQTLQVVQQGGEETGL